MDADKIAEIEKSVQAEYGPDAKLVHVSPSFDNTCDHYWPEGEYGTDMDGACTKCGMSFQRYIHCYCPYRSTGARL